MKARETCLFYRTGQNIDVTILLVDVLRPSGCSILKHLSYSVYLNQLKILLLAEPLVRFSFSKVSEASSLKDGHSQYLSSPSSAIIF